MFLCRHLFIHSYVMWIFLIIEQTANLMENFAYLHSHQQAIGELIENLHVKLIKRRSDISYIFIKILDSNQIV